MISPPSKWIHDEEKKKTLIIKSKLGAKREGTKFSSLDFFNLLFLKKF
jgi:hypothetical protein